MVGIVTATDLGHNLILDHYQYGTKVKSAMVKDVACVSSEDTIKDAVSVMFDKAPGDSIINQLPVVDDGELVGIISDGFCLFPYFNYISISSYLLIILF